jgi:hypothetical protein
MNLYANNRAYLPQVHGRCAGAERSSFGGLELLDAQQQQ